MLGLMLLLGPWSEHRPPPLGGYENDPQYYWETLQGQGLDLTEGSPRFDLLHVLATEVGIVGIFSDWAADVTFYANCMGLMLQ